jgi:hypothetical protein
MSLEKVFKTPTHEVVREFSPMEQNAIIQDIINLVRNNPNHATLGAKVDKYIKKVLK